VVISASDDPAWVSDSAMVPVKRPASIGCTHVETCSGVPNLAIRLALAMVSIRYPEVLTLAAEIQANPAWATVAGSCAPPSSASKPIPTRSALANACSASLTSGMTVTVVPSKVGSLASLSLLCGAK
jgi:hypothetical protein